MPSDDRRLHYRWSHIEAGCCGLSEGSPQCPAKVDRELKLDPDREYKEWPCGDCWECPLEKEKFTAVSDKYRNIDYNTFALSGVLKLTEVELFFLSSKMTMTSSSEWAVVYLGIGCGNRFRALRDEFFPGLLVVGFDPFEDGPFYTAETSAAFRNAELWNTDGTDFTYYVRCFDVEQDIGLVANHTKGRKVLLISDIRGVAMKPKGGFDIQHDMDLQWAAIKSLRPVSSLVKFDAPDSYVQFFSYAPGVLLKQVFSNYCTHEVRLMIDGVPQEFRRYNSWELYKKMKFHHEHVRGHVHETPQRRPYTACLDSCFDCSVLWNTVLTYATQNSLCPDRVLRSIIDSHVYIPGDYPGYCWDEYKWVPPTLSQRWSDVEYYLQNGMLTEAIAGLEANGEDDAEDTDWSRIAQAVAPYQKNLAQRLRSELKGPASRADLIQALGSLSRPFTLIKTSLNGLLDDSW